MPCLYSTIILAQNRIIEMVANTKTSDSCIGHVNETRAEGLLGLWYGQMVLCDIIGLVSIPEIPTESPTENPTQSPTESPIQIPTEIPT